MGTQTAVDSLIEDKQIGEVGLETRVIQTEAASLPEQITNPEEAERAMNLYTKVKKTLKQIENAEAFFTKPLKDQVKAIKAKFSPYVEPLEELEELLKREISAWRSSEEVRQAQAKMHLVEHAAKSVVESGDVKTLEKLQQVHSEYSEVAPKQVITEDGSAHFRKTLRYEITDSFAIPREFLVPDEKLILAALKADRQIPGVKSWVDSVPVVRT